MAELDKQRALERIKKCLALSQSTNPHEAESALRQARKLMEKFRLEIADVEASRAQEYEHYLGPAKRMPMAWVGRLANTVATALACVCFIRHGRQGQALIFIGETGSGELAAYAYTVLARQLEQHRKEFLTGHADLPRGKKRVLGTRFAEGWIESVAKRVEEFASMTPEAERAINAYVERHYPNVPEAKVRCKVVSREEYMALLEGQEKGKEVTLNRAVAENEQLKLAHA